MSEKLLKMAIEIADLPIKNGGSFHRFLVCLPEGKMDFMGISMGIFQDFICFNDI